MIKHVRRTATEWKHHLDAWKRSGLSQTEYCRQHDLNNKVFSLWKGKLAKKSLKVSESKQPTLVPSSVIEKTHVDIPVVLKLPNGVELKLSVLSLNQIDVNTVMQLCQIR